MVSQIAPKCSTSNISMAMGPIRDTIISTVTATGVEKMKTLKVNHIPELEKEQWTPHVKSVKRLLNNIRLAQVVTYGITYNK